MGGMFRPELSYEGVTSCEAPVDIVCDIFRASLHGSYATYGAGQNKTISIKNSECEDTEIAAKNFLQKLSPEILKTNSHIRTRKL